MSWTNLTNVSNMLQWRHSWEGKMMDSTENLTMLIDGSA